MNERSFQIARAAAGWDETQQHWVHGFTALPRNPSVTEFDGGKGLAPWLRANAQKPVPWKVQAPPKEKPHLLSERMPLAINGDLESLRKVIDENIVARLMDKDLLGRTLLHAAASSGNAEAVKMLAARCSGVPIEDAASSHGHSSPKLKTRSGGSPMAGTRATSPVMSRQGSRGRSPGRHSPGRSPARSPRASPGAPRKSRENSPSRSQSSAHKNHYFDEDSPEELQSPGGYESPLGLSQLGSGQGSGQSRSRAESPIGPYHSRKGTAGQHSIRTGTAALNNMLNCRDKVGDTPLHLSAAEGHEEIVEELLFRKAEVDIRNLAGRTPLHLACMNCHLDTISLLLQNGAGARVRDLEGRRPADMSKNREVLDALIATVGLENAVKGGPTPFGYGDEDWAVTANVRDDAFATLEPESEEWDEDKGVRKKVGTAGPIYRGTGFPRIRPLTPKMSRGPTRAGEDRSISFAGRFLDDNEQDWPDPPGPVAVRSNWYRMNDRSNLMTTAQTLRTRMVPVGRVMGFEKAKFNVNRIFASKGGESSG